MFFVCLLCVIVCRHESGRVGVEEVRGEVAVEMKEEEEEESHLESALAILIKEVFIIFDLNLLLLFIYSLGATRSDYPSS